MLQHPLLSNVCGLRVLAEGGPPASHQQLSPKPTTPQAWQHLLGCHYRISGSAPPASVTPRWLAGSGLRLSSVSHSIMGHQPQDLPWALPDSMWGCIGPVKPSEIETRISLLFVQTIVGPL